MNPVLHSPTCPARPCFEQYYGVNSAGVNFTRTRCGTHHTSARALNGYDPFRCVAYQPKGCTCQHVKEAA